MATGTTNGSSREYPLSARFSPMKHVVHATRGGETVLLDVRRGQYYTLNEIGSRIWLLICEGAPVGGIINQIREDYDAPAERVKGDAAALIGRLLSASLITCETR